MDKQKKKLVVSLKDCSKIRKTTEQMMDFFQPYIDKYGKGNIMEIAEEELNENELETENQLYAAMFLYHDYIQIGKVLIDGDEHFDYSLKMECNYQFDFYDHEIIKLHIAKMIVCYTICLKIMLRNLPR